MGWEVSPIMKNLGTEASMHGDNDMTATSAENVSRDLLSAAPSFISSVSQDELDPSFSNNYSTSNVNPKGLEPDAWDDAKLCAMYVQEATEHDNLMLKGSHDALDVLLIMAGLFSAVLTAFLVESYGMLQPDGQQATVDLLAVIAGNIDSSLKVDASMLFKSAAVAVSGSHTFVPSFSAWMVNLLWFLSLVFSLSAAFVATLAKQWLQAYTIGRHGCVETHARQRHFRYTGFLSWKTSEIIYGLPVLLQFSFVLFFIGLDILVFSINVAIGCIVTFSTALLLGFYFFTTFAPLFYLACPYRTPFSLSLGTNLRQLHYTAGDYVKHLWGIWCATLARIEKPTFNWKLDRPVSHSEIEYIQIEKTQQSIDIGIVEWLVSHSHKDAVKDAALVAISSIRPNFSPTKRLRDSGAIQLLVDRLNPCFNLGVDASAAAFRDLAAKSLPYLSSLFCSLRFCSLNDILPIRYRFNWRTWIVLWGDFNLSKLVSSGWDLNVLAIYLCASSQCDRAEMRRPNSEFKVMLELLEWHASHKIKLNDFSVWALLDSIAAWGAEFGEDSMATTRPAVTACLLKVLCLPYSMGDPITRAVGVALGVFVLDFRKDEISHYQDEDRRRTEASALLIRGVVEIMQVNLHDGWSRYSLSQEAYETGGMVICKLVGENNGPTTWPRELSIILLKVLKVSKSEDLTCKVLEVFRHLLSLDSLSSVPILLSRIFPLLNSSLSLSIQIKATQTIGEMIHWRVHRQSMRNHGVIHLLVKNLVSTSGDLSNASSLALFYLTRDSEARESMMDRGLAVGLAAFFASNSASPQALTYWSWVFIDSSWGIRRSWRLHTKEFKEALHQLYRAFEDFVKHHEDDDFPKSEVCSSPTLRTRDARGKMRSIKELLNTPEWDGSSSGSVIKPSRETLREDCISHHSSIHYY